jgi:thiosulfate/3-mercaptopyruvate sulfurtransferase
VADKAFVTGLLGAGSHEIVDARGSAASRPGGGAASRTWPPGHIPGSKNLPQGKLFNPDNSWKRGDDLRAEFESAGVDLAKPMVATCGSGVTACVLLFGAHLLGKEDVKLYDGSWSEWGADPATPKATVAA